MDDETLAAQFAQTKDLMDLCTSTAWVRQSAQLETAVEGQVEAGVPMQDYARFVDGLTVEHVQQLRRTMRIQSILFTSLQRWMASWNLGAGFEETYTLARQLIRAHLSQVDPAHPSHIDRLLAEDPGAGRITAAQQQLAIALLSQWLTSDDWQALADVAARSVSSHVLKAKQTVSDVA